MSSLSGVSSEDYPSLITFDKNHVEKITPRSHGLSPLPTSYASYKCATPDAKRKWRANSLSPVINVRTISGPQPSPGIKHGRMLFEAASLSPISNPIATVAGRGHSTVLPTDNLKVHAGHGDGGMRVLSKCRSEEKKVVNTRSGHQQTVRWKNDGYHLIESGCLPDFLWGIVGLLGRCEQLQAWVLDRLMCVSVCKVKMCKSSTCIS